MLSSWPRGLRFSIHLLVDGVGSLCGPRGFVDDVSMLVGRAGFPPHCLHGLGTGLGVGAGPLKGR